MWARLVKFRRGDRDRYEDLQGDVRSPGEVEFESFPTPEVGSPGGGQEPQDDTFTVDQAVDRIGFGVFQIKLSLLTGLAWMADAMEMMILAILSPALHCDWKLSNLQQALLTTVVFCGMMASSSIWGTVSDRYGRKVELILCSVFTFYYGILSAASPTYIWILILRGLVGFGIGGAPQAVTLYAEFLPSKVRAKCVVLIEIFWAIGTCFEVLLALFIMPTMGWRWLLGLSALPLLIFTMCCFWMPESARYDVACGHPEKALATLERIAKENGKPMPLGKLVHANVQDVKRGRIQDLFHDRESTKTTLLLWIIWLANAFSYYGIVLMTTELFEAGDECHGGEAGATGIIAEPPCRLECKQLTTKDYVDLLWTTLAEFPGLFITVFIIEWLGRKKTMALEFVIFSIFVYLVNLCTSRTVLTLFLFIARAFISGGFQAVYVYTPEVYPTTTRAIGLGACSGMARVGAIVTPFVAQVLLKVSVNLAVSVYGTVCLIAAVASMLLPIETKGRELQESTKPKEMTNPVAAGSNQTNQSPS